MYRIFSLTTGPAEGHKKMVMCGNSPPVLLYFISQILLTFLDFFHGGGCYTSVHDQGDCSSENWILDYGQRQGYLFFPASLIQGGCFSCFGLGCPMDSSEHTRLVSSTCIVWQHVGFVFCVAARCLQQCLYFHRK